LKNQVADYLRCLIFDAEKRKNEKNSIDYQRWVSKQGSRTEINGNQKIRYSLSGATRQMDFKSRDYKIIGERECQKLNGLKSQQVFLMMKPLK